MCCSHPFCEEIINENVGGKQTVLKSITLQPGTEGIDALVSSYFPETNLGDSKTISASVLVKERNRYVEKGYIDFDLSNQIPLNAKIKKATLQLFADTINQIEVGYIPNGHYDAEYAEWKVSVVLSPWSENSITWFNQLNISTAELITFDGVRGKDQALLLDVTSFIERKVKHDPDVYGLVMEIVKSQDSSIRFCSSDHQNSELRPKLNVKFEIEQ
jgi:hypothetical protein